MRDPKIFRVLAFTAILFSLLTGRPAFAQDRMSDKDVESLMKNLKEDSKTFQSAFNSSISHSTIRKTSQEKEYKATVQQYRNQVDQMLDTFQDKRQATDTLPTVMSTAGQIDGIFKNVQLGGSAKSTWAKCKREMNMLATQFNMPGH
jgi:Sec-independent protein translocase protein TatA